MSSDIEWFGIGELTERLSLFRAMLEVHGIDIRFSKTDENTDACKTLHLWLLRFGQMPNVDTHQKNNQKSKLLRIQGNELFRKKEELSNALECYNKAVCWAEPGSEDMAIGFANRSAIYFHWKLYDVCIENINLAVGAGCPGILLPKLERRREICLFKMQNDNEVELPVIGDLTLHFQSKVVNDRDSFYQKKYSFDIEQKRKEPQLSVTANPQIPFVANCLKMQTSAEKGRHVVTNEDLKPGQIISIEKPYTNALTKDHRYRKCANCFKENFLSLIPCSSCTCTMFCSRQCLAESENGFHMYECPVVDLLWTQFEEYALTLRMVYKAFTTFGSIEELIDIRKKANKNANATNAFSFDHTNDDVSEKVRYEWMHNLQTNEQFRMEYELMDRCCKVAILYHHLIEKTRFGEILRTERERDTLMAVILQHTQVSSINCFNCFQYDDVHHYAFTELKPLDVFSRGIYPLSSLFNHSCAPNTATIASGTKLVTYVTRPIKSKEEVTTCYKRFTHFQYDKETRQNQLALIYNFNCKCVACIDNYPKWFDDPRLQPGNRTDEMHYCSEVFSFDLNMDHMKIARFCSILDENADLYPCRSLFHIGLKLHRAFTLKFGNLSTEMKLMLGDNHSKIASAMEALSRRRR